MTLKPFLVNTKHFYNIGPTSSTSISEILEKVVANRLQTHIKNNHLSNPLQSAYRKQHSTESTLLKVNNDIIISMDKGEFTTLTLIDLSAAFDTIDHTTLTNRLSDWYGISGQAQIWFSSHLKNKHQSVTRGPGALALVNSIAKYQLQMCQRMYIHVLK